MPFWKKEKYSDAPTCTKCGAVYPTNARFCPNCGGEVKVPPAPTPSKPKKSEEAEEDWHKNMVKALKKQGWTNEEISRSGEQNHPIAGGKAPKRKKGLNGAEKQQVREAMGDVGTVLTFGPLGAALVGRKQRQRREKAQSDRIESLLKDIKNKR